MRFTRTIQITTLLIIATGLTGCNKDLKAERDRLFAENVQLREELDADNAALDATEMQRRDMLDEVSRLRMENQDLNTQLANAQSTPQPTTPNWNTGFDDIQGVEGEFQPGQVVARVEGDVLFDSGQTKLKSSAKKTLDRIAGVLNSTYAGQPISIEGHTDTDPIKKSKWGTNDRLSCERAMAVKDYLATKGVDKKRMSISGYGLNAPMDTKAKSRRVEIVVELK